MWHSPAPVVSQVPYARVRDALIALGVRDDTVIRSAEEYVEREVAGPLQRWNVTPDCWIPSPGDYVAVGVSAEWVRGERRVYAHLHTDRIENGNGATVHRL